MRPTMFAPKLWLDRHGLGPHLISRSVFLYCIFLTLTTLAFVTEARETDPLVELGRRIFFDSRFSADGKISCATCHVPEKAFSDGLRVAAGFKGRLGTRNTPTLFDVGYLPNQFWDGRRSTLEEQAADPLLNPSEHGMESDDAILSALRSDGTYKDALASAFGTALDDVTMDHVVRALAAFQRTLIAGPSAVDRYLYRSDKTALSEQAVRGLALFRGRAECSSCHLISETAAPLTDHQFHSLGISFQSIAPRLPELARAVAAADQRTLDRLIVMDSGVAGLGRFSVTKDPQDIGKFRTPSLRNVAVTAPYMHDGSVATIEAAIDSEIYYRSLQRGKPLILTPQEKADIAALLLKLTSDNATTE